MPCCLFTFHAYGTWMPDRAQGYVHRQKGLLPTDIQMAHHYRARQRELTVSFDPQVQRRIIDALLIAAHHQGLRLHAAATDPTHVHVLVSWRGGVRDHHRRRGAIKQSITRSLNQLQRRRWLAAKGSCRPVRDRSHFDHLTTTYLPSHVGCKYDESRGIYE